MSMQGPSNSNSDFLRCWPWLEASLAKFGTTHTKEQVRQTVERGQAVLWPGDRSVILTNVINHPIGLRSCNVWLQGGELEELKTMHPAVELWARNHHCDQMIAWGRDGWQSCGTRRRKQLHD